MAKQSTNLIVGVFVTLGVILGVVAIVWIGATSYFQKGKTYVAYFDESVQGLQKDSAVKFRGVDVGRVEDIRVAPDNRLIGVVMKINMPEDLQKNAVAQLKAAGITGIMFVELDLKKPGEPDLSPKINFPAEYPIIATRPSEIQQIISGVNEVVKKFKEINAKGISDQLIATSKAIEEVFKGKQMNSILTRVNNAAGNLEGVTAKANRSLGHANVEEVLAEAKEALKAARLMLTTVNNQVLAMKLPATLNATRDLARQLRSTGDNLRQSSETLDKLLLRLYDRPSDILFGKPPKKRWNE
jgi:phospholipid/cholesterol/gamma-HCH transport system substrate-binding protein